METISTLKDIGYRVLSTNEDQSPKQVLRCFIKEGKYGLALIQASGTAAAVFTKNLFAAAPVLLMKDRMARGRLDGIIVNSGNANVYTGERGMDDARRMAEIGAAAFGIVSRMGR